ncbi:MAG: hypothetical protein GWP75_05475 [Planctomycetia bacterium]|nr:hypothetical protein [Planctomycetia bacterium]
MTTRIFRNQIIAVMVMLFMTLPSLAIATRIDRIDEQARLEAALTMVKLCRFFETHSFWMRLYIFISGQVRSSVVASVRNGVFCSHLIWCDEWWKSGGQ